MIGGSADLPEAWIEVPTFVLFETQTGSTPSKKEPSFYGEGIPFVKPPELLGGMVNSAEDNLTSAGAEKARILPPGSVMVSCIGNLGKTGFNSIPVAFNQQINAIVPEPSLALPKFIFFQVCSSKYRSELESLSSATTISIVNKKKFSGIHLKIAPLNEQRRIVETIETLFARLDKGEEAVREVQKLLKRYRQSVLKSAVTGALTADWRAEREGKLESGAGLLARILKIREKNWQGRGKYKAPVEPDTTKLPDLPEGWVWASPHQLSSNSANSLCIGPFGSNLKVDDYRETGVPLIFVRHIRSQNFSGQNPKYVDEGKADELSSHKVYPGDLLITKMGDPPGDVAIYPDGSPEAIITADCIRFSVAQDGVSKEYLETAIMSQVVQTQIHVIAKGVAQQKVTLANFKRVSIPVPSFDEQVEISNRVSEALVQAKVLEAHCETELKRSAALRQSILKDAFSGRLVPQDPDDEPASELLERIQKYKKKRN